MIWERWGELYAWFEKIFFLTALAAGLWIFITTTGRWFWFSQFEKVFPREGCFPNPNIAAGFLGMALIWGVHKWLNLEKVSLFGLGFLLVCWGLTESRGAFVAMVAVFVLYLVLHMKEIERHLSEWKLSQWLVFGGVALFVVVALSLMVNRILNAEEADPRSNFRIDIWVSSFKMAMAQPLFGFGPGNFEDVYPYFRPEKFWNVFNPFAHNEYLQVAADCGLPSLGAILLLLWVLMREFSSVVLRTSLFKRSIPSVQSAELTFYLLAFEAVHNSVDFTFHEWSHRLILIGFVTFALKEKKKEDDLRVDLHFSRLTFFTATTLVAVFIIWTLGVGALRDYSARIEGFKANLLQRQGDLDGAELYAQKSLKWRASYMDALNTLGAVEEARALAAKGIPNREKHFQLADDYFQKAIQSSPYSSDPRENQIQSLAFRGRLFQAIDLQNQLIAKGPDLPTNYWSLGSLYLKIGRPTEALKPAQQMIDKYPTFLPGYLLKAQALETLGRKKDALQTYRSAQDMLQSLNTADPSGQVEPGIQRLQGHS
jgi:O-antigen ligase